MPKVSDTKYTIFFARPIDGGYNVGQISQQQFDNLVNTLYNAPRYENTCTCVRSRITFRTLGSYIFLPDRPYDQEPGDEHVYVKNLNGRTKSSPCEYDVNFYDNPILACAINFRTGKCKCPFMTSTFGAIILPELYGKQK